jgi:histidyl-tRNA synthetase
VPATGVSIGVDRLLAALRAKGRAQARSPGPVVVTVMDRDRMADYFAIVAELRNAGHPGRGLSRATPRSSARR